MSNCNATPNKVEELTKFLLKTVHYWAQLQRVNNEVFAANYADTLDELHKMLDAERFRYELEEVAPDISSLAYITKKAFLGDALRGEVIEKAGTLIQKIDELLDK